MWMFTLCTFLVRGQQAMLTFNWTHHIPNVPLSTSVMTTAYQRLVTVPFQNMVQNYCSTAQLESKLAAINCQVECQYALFPRRLIDACAFNEILKQSYWSACCLYLMRISTRNVALSDRYAWPSWSQADRDVLLLLLSTWDGSSWLIRCCAFWFQLDWKCLSAFNSTFFL
jgi:hypothetical protein